jgi:hypothetical protein
VVVIALLLLSFGREQLCLNGYQKHFVRVKKTKTLLLLLLLNCFLFNFLTLAGSNCPFFVFIYCIYGVNKHKKGQFEPARVRKLNEKQFTPSWNADFWGTLHTFVESR